MSGGNQKSKNPIPGKLARRSASGRGPFSWLNFLGSLVGRANGKPSELRDPKRPVVIQLLSYEITTEPIDDDLQELGLTAEQLERINRISEELHGPHPERVTPTLEKLVEEFPNVPKVWNHLAIAYQAMGRHADEERVIEETYRRFPDYLFGLTNYGMQRIHQGHPEEIPQILHGNFALHELMQGRRRYHLSEARSYFGLLASYFLAVQDLEQASTYLDMLEELDPDHPLTQQVRSRMMLALFEAATGIKEPGVRRTTRGSAGPLR